MNTLDVMEKYSQLCDELDAFMQEENRELRTTGSAPAFLSRKEEAAAKLADAVASLRAAEPADRTAQGSVREMRDRVLQKLLKLLLLSRESEQLLLKSMSPAKRAAPPRTSAALLRNAYRSHSA
jgi:hypothetical protein